MRRRNAARPVLEASRWARGENAYRRERALARRDGLWTSGGSVRAAFRVPDEQNAAVILREELARIVPSSGRGPVPNASLSGAEGAALRRLDLEAWRKIAKRPRLVFERTWEKPHEILRSELAGFKGAAQTLVDGAKRGKDTKANLLAAARLSALVAQEPCLISQFVAWSTGKRAMKAALDCGLGREVASACGTPSLRYGLRAMALDAPPPLRPEWRYVPRQGSGYMIPVSPWARRMGQKAALRHQARTLRFCRRLYVALGRMEEGEALRRYLPPFARLFRNTPFGFFPLAPTKVAQVADSAAEYRSLRQAALQR